MRFGIKNDLKTHIKRHTGNKDHLCHYCDYKSVDSSSLSQHIKMVHDKERPFVCSICGTSFGTKQKLTIHMNRHTGTKTHLCKYCDFKSVESSGLNRHVRAVHEKEKPFVCLICNKGFGQNSQLKTHISGVHSETGDLQLLKLKENNPNQPIV